MSLREVDLHITNKCCLNCSICCFNCNEDFLAEMSTTELINVIHQAKKAGASDIHFTGGEPLLREDLEELIRLSVFLDMEPRLLTNGMLLTESRARRLSSAGLQKIMISIDSPVASINDSIRGKGAFEGACKSIKIAKKMKWDIRINAVIHKITVSTFVDLICFSENLGVHRISAFYLSPIGRCRKHDELWLTPDDYMSFRFALEGDIQRLRQSERFQNMDIIVEPAYLLWDKGKSFDISDFGGCGGGCNNSFMKREYLLIKCNGDVYPCVMLHEMQGGLGNVLTHSLENILENDEAWSILKRDVTAFGCNDCSNLELCGGGCAGYSLLMSGDPALPDPRCNPGRLIPLCPIMKYNFNGDRFGGASDEVIIDKIDRLQ